MERKSTDDKIGLCKDCSFHTIIKNTRGSIFHLCEKNKEDKAFPKYPRLPVLQCDGFLASTKK